MNSRLPPTPLENLSQKGPGDHSHSTEAGLRADQSAKDPDKRGQQGNSKINTTHQGYQQDR